LPCFGGNDSTVPGFTGQKYQRSDFEAEMARSLAQPLMNLICSDMVRDSGTVPLMMV